jgi:hypothetical protein
MSSLAEASEAASRTVNAGMRASDIVDRVRSLYTRGTLHRELVDVNDVIQEMVVLLLMLKGIETMKDAPGELLTDCEAFARRRCRRRATRRDSSREGEYPLVCRPIACHRSTRTFADGRQ